MVAHEHQRKGREKQLVRAAVRMDATMLDVKYVPINTSQLQAAIDDHNEATARTLNKKTNKAGTTWRTEAGICVLNNSHFPVTVVHVFAGRGV